MTKTKNTKRALFTSVLSMMLCMAMLVGSTFAWFTDSVTSGKNKIVAGNLDVELYVVEGEEETPVTEKTNLFMEDALWEPGHVEVVNLKVANLGTLALQYKFGVNVATEQEGTNVAGKTFKLSDYIMFALIDGNNTYANREAAIAAAEKNAVKLSDFAVDENGVLLPEKDRYVTLVVYMPTTVGNEANYRGDKIPSINLGVTLVATQTPYENDSFGKDYDGNIVASASALKKLLSDGGNVSVANSMELPNKSTPESRTEVTKDTVLNLQESMLTFSTADATTYDNIAAIYVWDKNLTVNAEDKGGIDSDFYGFYLGSSENESPTLTINGGTYKAGSIVNVAQGTVYIKGGLFDGRSVYGEGKDATYLLNCLDQYYKSGEANIIVTGGTFINFDPSNNAAEGRGTNFVPEGYRVTSKVIGVDTYYTVVKDV